MIHEEMKDKDGWIEWSGGKCPVDGDTFVQIRKQRSSGGTILQLKGRAIGFLWEGDTDDDAGVIAYRIVEQKGEDMRPEDKTIQSMMDQIDKASIMAKEAGHGDLKQHQNTNQTTRTFATKKELTDFKDDILNHVHDKASVVSEDGHNCIEVWQLENIIGGLLSPDKPKTRTMPDRVEEKLKELVALTDDLLKILKKGGYDD